MRPLLLGTLLLLFVAINRSGLVAAAGSDTLWTRTFGGALEDRGNCVRQTEPDGGFIVAGRTDSFGGGDPDIYVIRTDPQGDTLWTRVLGGPQRDVAHAIEQTSDGGYIVAGSTESFGSGDADAYLARLDADGDTLWTRTYGGTALDEGWAVAELSSGGFIVAGCTESSGSGLHDVYLIRTDSAGSILWAKTFGGAGYDDAWSATETIDHGYLIAGQTQSFGAGDYDAYLIRTNGDGDTLWSRAYGGQSWDDSRCVQQTPDGGCIAGGWTWSFGNGETDFYLIRTDDLGDTLWTRTYGGTSYEWCYSIDQVPDGGFILAGETDSFGAGYKDVYIVRTGGDGAVIWSRTYGGGQGDIAMSIDRTADGGYAVAGRTESAGAGLSDVYLLRLGEECASVGAPEPRDHSSASLVFPNPLGTTASVALELAGSKSVRTSVYDAQGSLVASVFTGVLGPGAHTLSWHGCNYQGSQVQPGVYFMIVDIEGQRLVRKVVLWR